MAYGVAAAALVCSLATAGREAERAAGDRAVRDLAKKLSRLTRSGGEFPKKLAVVGSLLRAAAAPWNRLGDDRVLSKMRIEAGQAARALAQAEIGRIKDLGVGGVEGKWRLLEALRERIDREEWLASGFKSSIRLDVSFAMAELKFRGN